MIHVNTAGAQGPITIDPFVQEAKLTASDGAADDEFGGSVAISGNTVVVGALRGHGRRQRQPGGGLRVHGVRLRLDPGRQAHRVRWRGVRSFRLLGFDQRQHGGGRSAVRHGTLGGNTQLAGAAYVFTEPSSGGRSRTCPTLTQTAKLTASDGAVDDRFRQSVSISGNTVVVGATAVTVNGNVNQGRPMCSRSPAPVGAEHDPDRQAHRVRWRGGRLIRQLGFDQRQHGGGRSSGQLVKERKQGAAYVFTEPRLPVGRT